MEYIISEILQKSPEGGKSNSESPSLILLFLTTSPVANTCLRKIPVVSPVLISLTLGDYQVGSQRSPCAH
jgi:hypothetical protein